MHPQIFSSPMLEPLSNPETDEYNAFRRLSGRVYRRIAAAVRASEACFYNNRKELILGKGGGFSLKEEMAKVTLRNIQGKGHPYVELRENGKRFVFFCTLCLAPCYGETSLRNHLDGNLHAQRYAGAKLTLLGSNPWPFSDGVFFFHQSPEKETPQIAAPNSNTDRFFVAESDWAGAIVIKDKEKTTEAMNNGWSKFNGNEENAKLKANDIVLGLSCAGHDIVSNANGHSRDLVVPGVLVNDEISILGVKFIGYGHIASRIVVNDEIAPKVRKIWCEWLGDSDSNDQEMLSAAESDFSVVTFAYTYNLGRKAVVSDLGLLTSGFGDEIEYLDNGRKKRRQCFSDPGYSHDSQSDDVGSYEVCLYEHDSSEKALLQEDRSEKILTSRLPETQINETRLVLSREGRRDLRRQQRLAAERDCDVCKQPMLPGKDVATLLNRKTGNLACSSRNTNGAFHVFHVSCLVHWLLLCELEMWTYQSMNSKIHRAGYKSGRKGRGRSGRKKMTDGSSLEPLISSAFCPECQGTGMNIEGDELEKPTVPLSEIFMCKIKAIEAHKAWVKSPEVLQKCSTGLYFPSASEDGSQEKVLPLKLMHFYRAEE